MARTNIDLSDTLVEKAFKLTGAGSKKELVNRALEALVRQEARKGILKLEGKVRWKGNLVRMRKARFDSR